jgi:hypothetical protein
LNPFSVTPSRHIPVPDVLRDLIFAADPSPSPRNITARLNKKQVPGVAFKLRNPIDKDAQLERMLTSQ